jgi:hypothetical protein
MRRGKAVTWGRVVRIRHCPLFLQDLRACRRWQRECNPRSKLFSSWVQD